MVSLSEVGEQRRPALIAILMLHGESSCPVRWERFTSFFNARVFTVLCTTKFSWRSFSQNRHSFVISTEIGLDLSFVRLFGILECCRISGSPSFLCLRTFLKRLLRPSGSETPSDPINRVLSPLLSMDFYQIWCRGSWDAAQHR